MRQSTDRLIDAFLSARSFFLAAGQMFQKMNGG
jgi:hypothetical protein